MQPYHRKVNILHQLDLAIKRKVQQRSKDTKQINPKHLESNDKKQPSSTTFNPSQRNKSFDKQPRSHRNKSPAREQIGVNNYQNTEFLKLTQQLSEKRFNNRKMDKLVGLINYVLSSADKVMRHVNVSNFQAEFSVKLFLSDKETLLSELDNLKLEDLVNSANSTQSRSTMKSANTNNPHNNVLIIENHSLRAENSQYKKQLMLLEAEIKRVKQQKLQISNELRIVKLQREKQSLQSYDRSHSSQKQNKQVINLLKQMQQIEESRKQDKLKQHQLKYQVALKDKQIQKYLQILKQLISNNLAKTLTENLTKYTKVSQIKYGNSKVQQKNQKKRGQLQLIIGALQNQYNDILNDVKNLKKHRQSIWRLIQQKQGRKINQLQLYQILRIEVENNFSSNTSNISVIKNSQLENEKIKQLEDQIKQLLQQQNSMSNINSSRVKLLEQTSVQFKQFIDQTTNRLRQLCLTASFEQGVVSKMEIDELIIKIKEYLVDQKSSNSGQLEYARQQLETIFNQNLRKLQISKEQIQQKYSNLIKELKQQLEQSDNKAKQVQNKQRQFEQILHKQQQLESLKQSNQLQIIQLNKIIRQNQLNLQNKSVQLKKYKLQYQTQANNVIKFEEQIKEKQNNLLQLSNKIQIQDKIMTSLDNQLKLMEMELKEKDKIIEQSKSQTNYKQEFEINKQLIQQLTTQKQLIQNKYEEQIRILQESLQSQKQCSNFQQSALHQNLNNQIQTLKSLLSEQKNRVQRLESQVKTVEQISSKNRQLIDQIDSLKKQLQKASVLKQQTIASLQQLRVNKIQSQLRLKSLEEGKALEKSNNQTENDKVTKLQAEIFELKDIINTLKSEQSIQVMKIQLQKQELNVMLSAKIQYLENQLSILKQNQNQNNKNILSLNQLITTLQQQKVQSAKANQELQKQKQNFIEQLTLVNKQFFTNHNQLEKLKQIEVEFSNLKINHSELQKVHEETQFSYNTIKINYQQILTQIKNLIKSILEIEEAQTHNLEYYLEKVLDLVRTLKENRTFQHKQTPQKQIIEDKHQDSNEHKQELNINISSIKKKESLKQEESLNKQIDQNLQTEQLQKQININAVVPDIHQDQPAKQVIYPNLQIQQQHIMNQQKQQIISPIKYQMVQDDERQLFTSKQILNKQQNLIEYEQILGKQQQSKEVPKQELEEEEEFAIKSTKHLSIEDMKKYSVLDKSDIISNENHSRILIEQNQKIGEQTQFGKQITQEQDEEQDQEKLEQQQNQLILKQTQQKQNKHQQSQQSSQEYQHFQQKQEKQQQQQQQEQQQQQQLQQSKKNQQMKSSLLQYSQQKQKEKQIIQLQKEQELNQKEQEIKQEQKQQNQQQNHEIEPINKQQPESQVQFSDFKDQGNVSQLQSSNIISSNLNQNAEQGLKEQQILQSQFNDVEQSESVNSSVLEHQQNIQDNDQQTQKKEDIQLVLTESILKDNQLSQSQFQNFKQPLLTQSMLSDQHHEDNNTNEPNKVVQEQIINNMSVGDFGDVEPDEMSKSFINQQQEHEQLKTQINENTTKSQVPKTSQLTQQQSYLQKKQQHQILVDQHGFEDYNQTNSQLTKSYVQNNLNFDDFNHQNHQPLDNSIVQQKSVVPDPSKQQNQTK